MHNIEHNRQPKQLVTATTPDPVYEMLTIKQTDEVITTDPLQKTKPNREPSAQSVSERREVSRSIEILPVLIKGGAYDGVTNVGIV